MAYFDSLPATFKAYLDSLPKGLKLTMYIKEIPKGYSVILMYQPDAADITNNQTCSIKTQPKSAEKMLSLLSEPVVPTIKSDPFPSINNSCIVSPSRVRSKMRRIRTVPDLHKNTKVSIKRPAETEISTTPGKVKAIRPTFKKSCTSTHTLLRTSTPNKMQKTSYNVNWHHTYRQLMQPDNWTCRAFKTPLGWYHFLQNKLTGHKTAVHTATSDASQDVKTVYLSEDVAMQSVVDYVTSFPDIEQDPLTNQQKQSLVAAITERIYCSMQESV